MLGVYVPDIELWVGQTESGRSSLTRQRPTARVSLSPYTLLVRGQTHISNTSAEGLIHDCPLDSPFLLLDQVLEFVYRGM